MTAGSGPNAPNLFAPWALARLPYCWTGSSLFGRLRARTVAAGEVAERLNAPVLKTGGPSRAPWVRIPPSPPDSSANIPGIRSHGAIDKRVRQLCRAKLDTGAFKRLWSRASSLGMSSAPALLTISPSPPNALSGLSTATLFLSHPAARVPDARGFFISGVRP
jgi:hypothetical protein